MGRLGSARTLEGGEKLYPTHADYVAEVKASAVAAAVRAGFLLAPDAQVIDGQAQAAPVPARQ